MRGFARQCSRLAVVALVGLAIVAGTGGAARAQEATPATSEMEPEGVTFEPIGFAEGVNVPSPADLFVVRVTLDPGAVLPLDANDPSGGLVVVESGVFTAKIESAWTVTRGAAMQQAMATPEGGDMSSVVEAIAVGQEETFAAGDVAFIPGSVSGEIRNDGQEPAVALVFLYGPAGMMSEEATPTS